MRADLPDLVKLIRDSPGVRGKSAIGLVSEIFAGADWVSGPGDDGAVVEDAGVSLVVGGEAILPAFVASDPYGAGIAAVLTNVNDLAAMGAWPLAIVDAVTGPEPVARRLLEGMRWASELYRVPVVGGHLTITDGIPSLSAFGLGRTERPLSARSAAPGQTLVFAACLDGQMRADFPFFPSFDERGTLLADDVRLLAEVASRGLAVAAKDVSMAGVVGSLAMLLECNRLGVVLDLDALPVPAGVGLDRWLICFPCYAFLVCVPPERAGECVRAFTDRGLTAAPVGTLDGTGQLKISSDGRAETVFDLSRESVTNLRRPPAHRLGLEGHRDVQAAVGPGLHGEAGIVRAGDGGDDGQP